MERKIRKLPVDKETYKLLNYDPMYYISNSPVIKKKDVLGLDNENKEI